MKSFKLTLVSAVLVILILSPLVRCHPTTTHSDCEVEVYSSIPKNCRLQIKCGKATMKCPPAMATLIPSMPLKKI